MGFLIERHKRERLMNGLVLILSDETVTIRLRENRVAVMKATATTDRFIPQLQRGAAK